MNCPCGSGRAYADCCQPLIDNLRQADTAEELMRSRYSAFALGDADHLFRTWHPATRPKDVDPGALSWEGLEILDTDGGGVADDEGVVEFLAHFRSGTGRRSTPGRLHERSRFGRRAGRWFYLDGDVRN